MRATASSFLRLATVAAGCSAPLVKGQSLPAPDISPAAHFRFSPQAGTAWFLDGSPDGSAWSPLAGPFFATGDAVNHAQTVRPETTRFRLRFADPAALGPAPVSAAGCSLLMEHQGQPVEIVFMNDRSGFLRSDAAHARSFTATWTKTAPDRAEAILTGRDGTFTLLRLSFAGAQTGRWEMEEIPSPEAAKQAGPLLDTGVFTFRHGRFRYGSGHGELPADLTGQTLLLNESGTLTGARFTSASTVNVTTPEGIVEEGTYAYDPASGIKAKLHLNLTGLNPLELDLDLIAPGLGRFSSGDPPVRTGTFALPDSQDPPGNPDCPPLSIAGRTYVINDSAPCTLSFHADGTGTQTREVNGVVQATPFTYSYSRTGRNHASVAITFSGVGPSDLIDDYQMDFDADCAGAFQRASFANGSAAGTGTGTFGPGELAGRPAPPGF